MTEALGAINASLSTTGALSNMFIKVRCLDTKNNNKEDYLICFNFHGINENQVKTAH